MAVLSTPTTAPLRRCVALVVGVMLAASCGADSSVSVEAGGSSLEPAAVDEVSVVE